jgi:hypothetical protein
MADESTAVLVWWACLGAIGVVNLCLFAIVAVRARRRAAASGDPRVWAAHRRQIWLSAMFVVGCAFRSFLPRVEGERFSLVDSWLSSAMIARAVATVAELSLVAQWTLALSRWAKEDHAMIVARLAWPLLPLIAVAEICSWYTTLTTNFLGSVIEESIWAATATLMTLGLVWLWPRSAGSRRRFIGAAIVLNAAYVVFMCTVDVPMYALRWRRDEARGTRYLTIAEGIRDAQQRRIVTRRWQDWREEIPWMTLYFSAGVWISISLVRAPFGDAGAVNVERRSAPPAPGTPVAS